MIQTDRDQQPQNRCGARLSQELLQIVIYTFFFVDALIEPLFKGHERAFDNNCAVGHVAMPVVDIAVSDKVLFGSVEQNLECGKLWSSGERFVSFCPSVGGKLDEAQNRFQRMDRGCTKEQEPRSRKVHRWQMIVPKCKSVLVKS